MPPSILLCALEPDPWDLTNRLPRPWPPVGFGQWEALARDGGKEESKVKMFIPLLPPCRLRPCNKVPAPVSGLRLSLGPGDDLLPSTTQAPS